MNLAVSPRITRGRPGWLGLTPWKTCTSYPLASLLGALRNGSRATFELRPLFVCSTLTLLTESLHRRELAVCAKSRPEQLQQRPSTEAECYAINSAS
jgi:hypothetical protein